MTIYMNGEKESRTDEYSSSDFKHFPKDPKVSSFVNHDSFVTFEYEGNLYLYYENDFYDRRIANFYHRLGSDFDTSNVVRTRNFLKSMIDESIGFLKYGINISNSPFENAERIIDALHEEDKRSWKRMCLALELHKNGTTVKEKYKL